MRILVVEDDKILSDGLRDGLTPFGMAVDQATNLEMAKDALLTHAYGLMILDLGLPDGEGQDLIRKLRQHKKDLPILVLTARDGISDRITALDLGADDYMIKPFDLHELAARIRALVRRAQGRSAPMIEYKSIQLNPSTHEVYKDGNKVELSAREFSVLEILLEKQGHVLTREFLEDQLYSWNSEIESNAVEVYIHHLRKKLGSDVIRNIRGVGYLIP